MKDMILQNSGMEAPIDSEEKLREWLASRIDYMLEHETDLLLSTLYRLDIDEEKIIQVLHEGTELPVARGLALLVIERQKERNATKQAYESESESGNGWGWGL